jgi:hypothetical protein
MEARAMAAPIQEMENFAAILIGIVLGPAQVYRSLPAEGTQ